MNHDNHSDEESPLLTSNSNVNSTSEQTFDSTSTIISVHQPTGKSGWWLPILLGQIASLLICLSGVASISLTDYGLSFPSLQNFVAYFLISAIFATKLASRRTNAGEEDFMDILRNRGWKYFLITLSDVLGNYLMVRAYQYTSLTSVQLLDCFSIPTVLVLSYLCLRSRYGHFHYFGISLCLLGVGCLVWADILSGRTNDGNSPWIGDLMCLAGAFLYGLSNVSQEFFVKHFNPDEFLTFVGLFGCCISAVQTCFYDFSATEWTTTSILVLMLYGVTMCLFYSIVAHLMVMSTSVALNLSILSADFYSIIVGIFLYHYDFSVLYFMAFMLVMGGVGIFTLRPVLTSNLVHVSRHHESNLNNSN